MRLGERPFFRFCPYCGAELGIGFVGGRERPVCFKCGFVQFLNPTVGVAVIVFDEKNRVLLGRRLKDPGRGLWCIPCGHVEWGEDVREAAKREFLEETGLVVEVEAVFEVLSNFHNPEHLTVGVWFLGRIVGGKLSAGDDLSEVRFFDLDALPEDLAFPTDRVVLKRLCLLFKKRF